MYDSNSKGLSYSAGFFILIAFAIAGIFIASAISLPIWTAMTGLPISAMEEGIMNPVYSDAGKVLQTISAVFGFFIPTLIVASLLNRRPFRLLGFSSQVKPGQVGLVILIMGISLFVSSSLSYFTRYIPITESWQRTFDDLENTYNRQVAAIIGLNSSWEYILALIIMAFLPALCEETLFRGGLQNFLSRATRRPWLSILIVSILFSAVHFSYYGFFPRFFLGLILGFIYQYSGRIWLNILAHFLNNAIAITALYIYKKPGESVMDSMAKSSDPSWLWGLFTLPALIGLLILFRRISVKPQLS